LQKEKRATVSYSIFIYGVFKADCVKEKVCKATHTSIHKECENWQFISEYYPLLYFFYNKEAIIAIFADKMRHYYIKLFIVFSLNDDLL
jgi:hypothetical protein